MGALGRRVSVPRFARGRGKRCWAGNQLLARSDRCAGCRDVVTRAWPGSSYSWERIDRDLRGRPAGSCGAAGSAGSGLRRIFFLLLVANLPFCRDKTTTGKQLRVVVMKTVYELGRREEDCAAVL